MPAGDEVRLDSVAQQRDAVGEVVLQNGVSHSVRDRRPRRRSRGCASGAAVGDAADQGSHLIGVGVVDADRDTCPAGFVDEASRLLDRLAPPHGGAFTGGSATGHVHGGARRAELNGNAAARPAGAAGDDGNATAEVLGVLVMPATYFFSFISQGATVESMRTGRPRTVSDEAIFEAVRAVVTEVGPPGLTLAAVADRSGSRPPR